MKVAVYHNNHDVRVEDRRRPVPAAGEILVETKACGVCVADTMEWYLAPKAPLVLGHEPTGVIAELGDGVSGFKVGDRVAVHHHVPCLICNHCRRGNYTMCSTFRSTHILPGGFSEFFTASKPHVDLDVLRLPDHISYEVGTLVEPLACVIHAIHQAKIQAGDKIILIGTGSMGLMFIQALKSGGSGIWSYMSCLNGGNRRRRNLALRSFWSPARISKKISIASRRSLEEKLRIK